MQPRSVRAILLLVAVTTAICSAQQSTLVSGQKSNLSQSKLGQLPLTFEANRGQVDPQARFVSRGKGYVAFLTSGGMTLSLRPSEVSRPTPAEGSPATSKRPAPVSLQFNLIGASANSTLAGENLQPGVVNYFIGNNPKNWHTNVPTYNQVRSHNVYPGIDLVYYGNHRQLEYDFEIAAGVDPNKIQFQIAGANEIQIDESGDLLLETANGVLRFQTPVVYQEVAGQRVVVDGRYALVGSNQIVFQVPQYDKNKPLVIDPVLVYSTYLGGSGADNSTGIAVDSTGDVYVAGFTDSADFPSTTSIGSPAASSTHVFVAKLDPTGSTLIYADYIGGNGLDYGYGLALDSSNNVYVTGSTDSTNFPTTGNAYQGTYPGGFNAFLTEISAGGSALSYSTYLGGNGSDVPSGIALDGSGNMIIGGSTSSTNFPVTNGAYQSSVSPNQGGLYGSYGFLTKFAAGGASLVYSTYLGGSSNVALNCGGTPCWPQPTSSIASLALDASGNVYTAGATNTYDFPVTPGAYLTTDSTQQNGTVGFVSKFNGSGSLQYSTYFYESSGLLTSIAGIAVDTNGSAYVTGLAISDGTFPITTTSICNPNTLGTACSYAFVTKFDPTGETLTYSTFLGANNYATPSSILLDSNNDAYVLTGTTSNTFSTVNPIEAYTNGNDILLVEIDPTGSTQLWATYLGGSADETPTGMVADANGNLYITGDTDSTDFPTTQGAYQSIAGGNGDAFIAKIGPASAPAVSLSPTALQFAQQSVATTSAAQTVLVRNMGSAALTITAVNATGDFAQTNTCGSSVPAASICTFSITFTPTAGGTRNGTIAIQDNAAGSPHTISLTGSAIVPTISVTPLTLTFGTTSIGSQSAAQTVTVANTSSTATLSVANVQASGDFTQTNTCSAAVAAGANCTISVTFAPTASGTRTGTLTISDNASATPQTVALTGTGSASQPVASLSQSTLTFAGLTIGTASAAQKITLSNTGSASLSISSIQASGDFSQTNTCGSSVAAGANCSISLVFTPTVSGSRTGTLTINDNASPSSQTVSLTGTGLDFSLASTPTSVTVKSGSNGTYTLTIAPLGGSFTSAIKLSCGTMPTKASCSFSSSSVTPNGSQATSTLTITTASNSAALAPMYRSSMVYAFWMHLPMLGVFGMIAIRPGAKRNRKSMLKLRSIILLALLASLMILTACAGGTGISNQSSGTPTGTYTVTVTGASGSLQHSTSLTLVVQ